MVFNSIIWARPWCLAGGLIVLFIVMCLSYYVVRIRATILAVAAPAYTSLMLPRYSLIRTVLRNCLLISAAVAIWIALLQPRYPLADPIMQRERGRDLIVAVDISRSMLVEDCNGVSRLIATQNKIAALAGALTSERIGLLVFSDAATTLCPLTKDINAFRLFVDMLDASILSGTGSTSLAAAIHAAGAMFNEETSRKNKLLVMITDGEDFVGQMDIAQQHAQSVDLQISVLGVGSEQGGPIPLLNEEGERRGHQRDGQNSVVISKRNEQRLRALVAQCNGLYQPLALENDQDVAAILQWVRAREAELGEARAIQGYEDCFMWFTGWAWCALVIAWIL